MPDIALASAAILRTPASGPATERRFAFAFVTSVLSCLAADVTELCVELCDWLAVVASDTASCDVSVDCANAALRTGSTVDFVFAVSSLFASSRCGTAPFSLVKAGPGLYFLAFVSFFSVRFTGSGCDCDLRERLERRNGLCVALLLALLLFASTASTCDLAPLLRGGILGRSLEHRHLRLFRRRDVTRVLFRWRKLLSVFDENSVSSSGERLCACASGVRVSLVSNNSEKLLPLRFCRLRSDDVTGEAEFGVDCVGCSRPRSTPRNDSVLFSLACLASGCDALFFASVTSLFS